MSNGTAAQITGKLSLIDQKTHARYTKEIKTTFKINNSRYQKTAQIYNLYQFINSKRKSKRPTNSKKYAIYKKIKQTTQKRKRKKSKLKKSILMYRLSKNTEGLNMIRKSENEELSDCLQNLHLRSPRIHSRRFREYCNNTTSQELRNIVESLLRELNRFQMRAFQFNEFKGRSRRRIVVGFREVNVQMKLNKIKFVVIASDCEMCDLQGGLDDTIIALREDCRLKNIPCAFALQRRQLSYALFKKSPVSCVGVINYDGAQNIFVSVLKELQAEKLNYEKLMSQPNT